MSRPTIESYWDALGRAEKAQDGATVEDALRQRDRFIAWTRHGGNRGRWWLLGFMMGVCVDVMAHR